jgi:hypothetical protein
MTTEKLIIELDAKTQKLEAALTRVEEDLQGVASQTKKTDGAFKKFNKGAKVAADGAVKLSTAALALATAISAVVLASSASQRELSILSRQAKLSTEDFEALAFATKQYGINAEQIADISKDLSDKLGEFGKAGTGAFQDFADVTGLTKEQAKATAIEFQNLSGDQVIGEMVRRMEAAGATANEMTFALESMGNDLSRLTPLFVNNSAELNKLTGIYKKATEQLNLTSAEVEGLKGAATSFDLMTDSMSKAGTLISAQLAPLLSEFFGGLIDVVPDATQVMVDFINTFKDADEIKSIKSLNNLIDEQKVKVSELRQEQNELGKTFATMLDSKKSLSTQYDVINIQIKAEEDRIASLIEARDKLTESERLADIQKKESGLIGGSFDPNATGDTSGAGTGDEIQAIRDRFKSEEVLLAEKLVNETILIGDDNMLRLQIEEEYLIALAELRNRYAIDDAQRELDLSDLFKDSTADDLKELEKSNKGKEKSDGIYIGAALAGADALFEGNKAVDAGLVLTKTAVAIMNQLSGGDPLTAFARAAAVGVTGAVQLANVLSATKGGGGSSTQSSPPQITSTPEPEQTTELAISDTDVSGASQSQNITISIEGGDDELAVALSGILSKAKVNGAIT